MEVVKVCQGICNNHHACCLEDCLMEDSCCGLFILEE